VRALPVRPFEASSSGTPTVEAVRPF